MGGDSPPLPKMFGVGVWKICLKNFCNDVSGFLVNGWKDFGKDFEEFEGNFYEGFRGGS